MLPDRVSNPVSLTYESGALPIALHGPAGVLEFALSLVSRNSKFFPLKVALCKKEGKY